MLAGREHAGEDRPWRAADTRLRAALLAPDARLAVANRALDRSRIFRISGPHSGMRI
jgi:hypothetical protein